LESKSETRRGINLKLSFPGANPHLRLEPFNRLDTRISYFFGNDPEQWYADVPVWGGVRYVDLYPGVDLEVTSEEGRWTWRFAIRDSQFAISNVRLRVEGADGLALDDAGHLRPATAMGDFTLPLLTVEGAMPDGHPETSNLEPGIYEVSSPFSSIPPLLGPSAQMTGASDLLYSTFLGGESADYGYAIAVDEAGNVYVTGETYSFDFPTTPGAFDADLDGGEDAFVVKLNTSGADLDYATFLGGSGGDVGYAIAVDGAGSAYVTGGTGSSDFPTTSGAYDTSYNGGDRGDTFVVKLNPAGGGQSDLLYATFLGGNELDWGYGITVDG
jgi:hypothetical protein